MKAIAIVFQLLIAFTITFNDVMACDNNTIVSIPVYPIAYQPAVVYSVQQQVVMVPVLVTPPTMVEQRQFWIYPNQPIIVPVYQNYWGNRRLCFPINKY